MSEVEAIAEVLELHSGRRIGDGWRECVCGQLPPLDPDAWRTHVAEQIAARLAAGDRDTALRERVEAAVNDDLTPSLTCWLTDTAHEPLPSNPHYASVNPEWLRLLIAEARAIRTALDASPTGTDPSGAGP